MKDSMTIIAYQYYNPRPSYCTHTNLYFYTYKLIFGLSNTIRIQASMFILFYTNNTRKIHIVCKLSTAKS